MNFTREPVIETIITPKEGYKLVLRSSKGVSEEEFFVDAVEVISFGKSCFFRSLEKPKIFLVPAADYEVLEVREARMVLKKPVLERGIKIAGGRDAVLKPSKVAKEEEESEQKIDKRRERRRYRKKKEKGEDQLEEEVIERRSLIPPPSTLISDSMSNYQDEMVKEELGEEEEVSVMPSDPETQE
ncbi:MAG: hypothetical protein WAM28_08595 [Chlamydiales bacterium]